jgi:hypothetical protein
MKVKTVALFLTTVLVSLIVIVLWSINHSKNKLLIDQKQIPEFVFETLEGKPYSRDSISYNTGEIAICHFDPDCHYCVDLANNISKLSVNEMKIPLIMVSSAKVDRVIAFCDSYNLQKFPSITILVDVKHQFSKYFGSNKVPVTYYYKNSILNTVFQGEADINFLTKH